MSSYHKFNPIFIKRSKGQPQPQQRQFIRNSLKKLGIVTCSGQKGAFLRLYTSLSIQLAVNLVKKVLGKGIQVTPSPPGQGRGKQIHPAYYQPVPYNGTGKSKKKNVDKPLTNSDLLEWCIDYKIPLKRIFFLKMNHWVKITLHVL